MDKRIDKIICLLVLSSSLLLNGTQNQLFSSRLFPPKLLVEAGPEFYRTALLFSNKKHLQVLGRTVESPEFLFKIYSLLSNVEQLYLKLCAYKDCIPPKSLFGASILVVGTMIVGVSHYLVKPQGSLTDKQGPKNNAQGGLKKAQKKRLEDRSGKNRAKESTVQTLSEAKESTVQTLSEKKYAPKS